MISSRSPLAIVSVLVGMLLPACRKPSRSVSPISTTCLTGVEVSATPYEPAAAHDANDFTFALYRATSSCHKENALVSGFVARHTLGTLAAASVTPAPADIWRSLGYGASETAGRDELAGWQAAANGVSFTSGARVFHDRSLRLDAAFERRAVTAFGQHFEAIDLQRKPDAARERIGAWVSESTGGQLSGPVPKAILDKDTSVVVGTAFGMSADWDSPFFKGLTTKRDFVTSSGARQRVKMMSQLTRASYGKLADAELLDLPLAGERLAVLFVLPPPGSRVDTLERRLDRETYERWVGHLEDRLVDCNIPRFETEVLFDITPALSTALHTDVTALRMFENKTASAGVRVLHQAKVAVDEAGVRASASAIGVKSIAANGTDAPPTFTADRPFLFMIHDRKSVGAPVLLVGRIENPATE